MKLRLKKWGHHAPPPPPLVAPLTSLFKIKSTGRCSKNMEHYLVLHMYLDAKVTGDVCLPDIMFTLGYGYCFPLG